MRAGGFVRTNGATAALVASVLLTLATTSAPATAQTSESECLRRAEAVKTTVVRRFGGDNVNYGFFRRADRASELCRSGQIGEALGIIAALKADVRGYWKELFEDR